MGSRSRKRRQGPAQAPAQPKLRGEARNEEIRTGLEPLAPDERPRPLKVAAVVAAAVGVANLVMLAAGYDVRGQQEPSTAGAILFALVMFVMSIALWQKRYWAVLGFQCLLAITAVAAGLALLVASNVWAAVLCVLLIGASGTLFWFLIRVMARIQMPDRPGSVTRHG
ncbi:MAG TPA: hypothetical protein VM266_08290 [Solirubrobacteraceae bacterium]|nr:hypothetical protein [Solirubrobacteraceae bacterium]